MTVQLGDYRDYITEEHHIQAIITDPPYNMTQLAWDGGFDPKQFWQLITPQLAEQCVVILTAQMRLAVDLISTATIPFRHDLVWEKPNGTGQVRYQPNRCHELVLVFGRGKPVYNPQLVAAYIKELRQEAQEKYGVNYQSHLQEMAMLRDEARKLKQMSPAVTAEKNRGQVGGLYIDRQVNINANVDLSKLSPEELQDKLDQMYEEDTKDVTPSTEPKESESK